MDTSQSLDLLVPQRRPLWDGIKGIPGSMQLVDFPRLQNTWAYGYIFDGLKYLAAGAVVDAVRRSFVWLYNRMKLRACSQIYINRPRDLIRIHRLRYERRVRPGRPCI